MENEDTEVSDEVEDDVTLPPSPWMMKSPTAGLLLLVLAFWEVEALVDDFIRLLLLASRELELELVMLEDVDEVLFVVLLNAAGTLEGF